MWGSCVCNHTIWHDTFKSNYHHHRCNDSHFHRLRDSDDIRVSDAQIKFKHKTAVLIKLHENRHNISSHQTRWWSSLLKSKLSVWAFSLLFDGDQTLAEFAYNSLFTALNRADSSTATWERNTMPTSANIWEIVLSRSAGIPPHAFLLVF